MVHVTVRNLHHAFAQHWKAAGPADSPRHASHRLLLWYAAECGARYAVLRARRANSTECLSEQELGHDLRVLLGCLYPPADLRPPRLHVAVRSGHAQEISISRWHEAWRYGLPLHPGEEPKVEAWLDKVCHWLASR